jgi:hypothetical protein
VERIAGLMPVEREAALGQLLILAGLRHLEEIVERGARKMPILGACLLQIAYWIDMSPPS